jgi:hypothetical protein
MMKKSVVKGDSLDRRICGPRLKPQRDPRYISPTVCPLGTLNLKGLFWMCLISHCPVISAKAADRKLWREQRHLCP